MADISHTVTATVRKDASDAVSKDGVGVVSHVATIELAAQSSGATIDLGKLPSNARILGLSHIVADDLATSGSPTLDIGLGSVDSNVTSDPDALNDGLAASSAITSTSIIKDAANYGKKAYEFVNGQSTDPKGLLNLYASVKDAATNATGTVTVEVLYTVD